MAASAYEDLIGLSYDDGPSIYMTLDDHARTSSHSRSADAPDYRQQQRELVEQGKFMEALEMDIAIIQKLFPDGRYEKGIRQAREHASRILPEKLKPRSGVTTPQR